MSRDKREERKQEQRAAKATDKRVEKALERHGPGMDALAAAVLRRGRK